MTTCGQFTTDCITGQFADNQQLAKKMSFAVRVQQERIVGVGHHVLCFQMVGALFIVGLFFYCLIFIFVNE